VQCFRPSDERKGVKLQWCRSPTSKGKTYEEWLSDDFILKDSLRKLTLNAVAKKIGIEVQVL
jgi:hypothetical protein